MKCPKDHCRGILEELDREPKIGVSYQCNECKEIFCIQHNRPLPKWNDLLKLLENAGLEPYLYHKAMSTSYYIKFAKKGMCSLRVGDHVGKAKYSYKWNLRSDIANSHTETDKGIKRFYYHIRDIKVMILHMQRYLDYVIKSGRR